jgi:hypothetical protein
MKFNFEKSCAAMLIDLGATPVAWHRPQFTLNTIAGKLLCTPFEDWLACQFEDEKLAVKHIGSGCLNRFNGKWNWHFDKPDEDDLDDLKETLQHILTKKPS